MRCEIACATFSLGAHRTYDVESIANRGGLDGVGLAFHDARVKGA